MGQFIKIEWPRLNLDADLLDPDEKSRKLSRMKAELILQECDIDPKDGQLLFSFLSGASSLSEHVCEWPSGAFERRHVEMAEPAIGVAIDAIQLMWEMLQRCFLPLVPYAGQADSLAPRLRYDKGQHGLTLRKWQCLEPYLAQAVKWSLGLKGAELEEVSALQVRKFRPYYRYDSDEIDRRNRLKTGPLYGRLWGALLMRSFTFEHIDFDKEDPAVVRLAEKFISTGTMGYLLTQMPQTCVEVQDSVLAMVAAELPEK